MASTTQPTVELNKTDNGPYPYSGDENHPPPYNDSHHYIAIQDQDENEDENHGFWSPHEGVPFSDSSAAGGFTWGLSDILCAVAYTLLIVALVMNMDVFIARWIQDGAGVATGSGGMQGVEWMEVHICGIFPSEGRAVLGSQGQMWRFISGSSPPDSKSEVCKTGVVTLMVSAEEASKLISGGEILVSGAQVAEEYTGGEDTFLEGKFESDAEMPDDLAEERKLRQTRPELKGSHTHAGFGGPCPRRRGR